MQRKKNAWNFKKKIAIFESDVFLVVVDQLHGVHTPKEIKNKHTATGTEC